MNKQEEEELVATVKAIAWLQELRGAVREWKMTDFRTREYGERVDDVLRLIKSDYIDNALKALEGS